MKWRSIIDSELGRFRLRELLENDDHRALFSAEQIPSQSRLGSGFGGGAPQGGNEGGRFVIEIVSRRYTDAQTVWSAYSAISDKPLLAPINPHPVEATIDSTQVTYAVFKYSGKRLSEILSENALSEDLFWNAFSACAVAMTRLHAMGMQLGHLSKDLLVMTPGNAWKIVGTHLGESTGTRFIGDGDFRRLVTLFRDTAQSKRMTTAQQWISDQLRLSLQGNIMYCARIATGPNQRDFTVPRPTVLRDGEEFEFAWNETPKIESGLLAAPDLTVAKDGMWLHRDDLSQIGEIQEKKRNGLVRVPLSSQSEVHIIPFAAERWLTRLGSPMRLSSVPEVKNLRLSRADGLVWLTWEWPRDLRSVRVLLKRDRFPKSEDGDNIEFSEVVHDFHYQYNQKFVIPRNWLFASGYIQVYGVSPLGKGEWAHSSGLPEDTRVYYQFSPFGSFY